MDTNDNAEKKPVQEKGGMLKDNSSSDFLFDPETNGNNMGKTAITGALATQPRIKLVIHIIIHIIHAYNHTYIISYRNHKM